MTVTSLLEIGTRLDAESQVACDEACVSFCRRYLYSHKLVVDWSSRYAPFPVYIEAWKGPKDSKDLKLQAVRCKECSKPSAWGATKECHNMWLWAVRRTLHEKESPPYEFGRNPRGEATSDAFFFFHVGHLHHTLQSIFVCAVFDLRLVSED
jgi:hypothetical protein